MDVSSAFTEAYNKGFQASVRSFNGIIALLFLACISYTILTAFLNRNPEMKEKRLFRIFEKANFMVIFGCSAYLFVSLFIKPLW